MIRILYAQGDEYNKFPSPWRPGKQGYQVPIARDGEAGLTMYAGRFRGSWSSLASNIAFNKVIWS